jgi:hypothetical protein
VARGPSNRESDAARGSHDRESTGATPHWVFASVPADRRGQGAFPQLDMQSIARYG